MKAEPHGHFVGGEPGRTFGAPAPLISKVTEPAWQVREGKVASEWQ